MADTKAKQVIAHFDREFAKQANTRNLWQRTADVMWPHAQINTTFTPGTDRMKEILDTTPMLDMLDMVSGFKQVLMPSGQTFFVVKAEGGSVQNGPAQRYLSMLTEVSHERIFASNLSLKMDDVLISLITFGPGGIFTEWKKQTGLNYKTPKIGSYILIEDSSENVIGSIHRFKISAKEAYETYGEKAGAEVVKAAKSEDKAYDDFWFLYKVVPNKDVDPLLSSKLKQNMPYSATVVSIKDKCTVDEGGFLENPYSFARWMRPEYEKDGRGIGTEMLPQIKILFQMTKDFRDCGNRWNHPPRQALVDSVEGVVDARPDALNWVQQIDAIRTLDPNINGNFPISEKTLGYQTDIIDRAFFKNAFAPLEDLKGDRRTTLEIQERIRGTLKKLGPPVGRIWYELLTHTIERSILELIRNHEVPAPPDELSGKNFGIEYVGPLALALKSEQARGMQEWLNFVSGAHAAFPEQHIDDNVDFDDAIPRIGLTFGVNVEDISTPEERDAKRAARAQKQQAQEQLIAAQAGAKAYKDGSKSAEEGSPAEALMQQAG